jgi:hypothetical protein
MRFRFFVFSVLLAGCSDLFLNFSRVEAQQPAPAVQPAQSEALLTLPEAPMPQFAVSRMDADLAQNQAPAQPQQQSPSQTPNQTPNSGTGSGTNPGTSSSAAQQAPQQTPQQPQDQTQDQHEKAEQQIKQQEHQRVLGIVPEFNTSYLSDAAVPLTAGQKIKVAFRTTIDPVTFGEAFLVAGYHEANDDYGGFGWGAQGYFKRAGAAYLDSFDGTMIGNGLLPALLHQDPRYFRLGHGSTTHRLLYAISTSFICKGDKSRKWEPNISNVGGNIAAGAISNLYYPAGNSGWGQTIGDGMLNTVVGTVGGVFQEFWPDLSRKFLHKDPTHGLDAQQTR